MKRAFLLEDFFVLRRLFEERLGSSIRGMEGTVSITVNAGERFNVQERDEWKERASSPGQPAAVGTFRGRQGVEAGCFQGGQ